MNQQTINAIIFLAIFLLLVGISHLLFRFFKVSSENSRKLLHVTGGILALCSPSFFKSHWVVLILCSLAFLLLFYTYIKHLLPAIHQTKRKSIGSVIFPIPIYICFVVAQHLDNNLLFYIPVSLLTISDSVAEWSGKRWGVYSLQLMNNQKTLAGCICFAISSILIVMAWSIAFKLPIFQIVLMSITTCIISTIVELVSTKGLDNLTVPLSSLLWLLVFKVG